jgi:hypothetical protein
MLRKNSISAVIAATVLISSHVSYAGGQSNSALSTSQPVKVPAPHKPVPPRLEKPVKWHSPATPRSMVGGLWTTDASFKSTIHLKNGVENSAVTVSPILYLSNGKRVVIPDVTLEPSGTAVISINDALRDAGIAPWATLTGYVEVQYKWPWDPLCVTVISVDAVHSVVFTSFLKPLYSPSLLRPHFLDTASRVRVIEGMWWKQETQVMGFVSLSNVTEEPIAATVRVTDGQGRSIGDHRLTVSPHGTKTLRLSELNRADEVAGGIQVSYTGDQDALSVNGGLQDQASGYSAGIQFIPTPAPSEDTRETKVITYAEIGLMNGTADPMMLFPADTVFTPYSVVGNVSDQVVHVSPALFWMQSGVAHSASLAQFTLPPHRTQLLDMRSLLSEAGLIEHNGSFNLILDVEGQPGSVLMASGSVDQKNNYVFEVAPRGVKESASKNLGYWSTANGDDTMVTLWNPADEAQDFVFTFFFSGGHYNWPVHLGPKATRTFNVSEVIQNQIPDDDGNLIPSNIHDGSAKISGTRGENEHILVVMDAGTYNVRKATCSGQCVWCNGATDAWLTIPTIPNVNNAQLTMTDQWNSGTQYNLTNNSGWTSYQTNIATVKSSGGMATGVSPGAASFGAYDGEEFVYAQSCVIPPCPVQAGVRGSGGGTVLAVTISIKSSGTAASDDSARGAYHTLVGTYNLGNFVDPGGFCTIGYEASGKTAPSSYSGTVTLVRTKGGVTYRGSTGQTVNTTYPPGTPDTSEAQYEDTNPQSGGSNGVVYDLDAPGVKPLPSEIGRMRLNFFENAQIPDGTYVANEVGFYARLSCLWGSAGNTFKNDVTGDNVLGMGTTKTSWNLQ